MAKVQLFGVPSSAGIREITAGVGDNHNAPAAVRAALVHMLHGYDIVKPYDDRGDLAVAELGLHDVLRRVEGTVEEIRRKKQVPLALGGAHTMTYGSLSALKKTESAYTLVYFDAHPDLMPRTDIDYGSYLYHALKNSLFDPARLVMVGLRWVERPEMKILADNKIRCYAPADVTARGVGTIASEILKDFPPPYYLSIDLDGIDPTFAPGVSNPTPFGLNPNEVLCIVERLCAVGACGAEIVQLSPQNDTNGMTARLAASLLISLAETIAGGQ